MECTADHAELRNAQQSGVILLKKCIFDMPSYTYALKAQRMLRTHGYQCRVVRREKSAERSCGYSLVIDRNCKNAVDLLDRYDIPYSLRNSGGEDDDKL